MSLQKDSRCSRKRAEGEQRDFVMEQMAHSMSKWLYCHLLASATVHRASARSQVGISGFHSSNSHQGVFIAPWIQYLEQVRQEICLSLNETSMSTAKTSSCWVGETVEVACCLHSPLVSPRMHLVAPYVIPNAGSLERPVLVRSSRALFCYVLQRDLK